GWCPARSPPLSPRDRSSPVNGGDHSFVNRGRRTRTCRGPGWAPLSTMRRIAMKARSALGGLALILGMALPAAAEPPDGVQVAQAQPAPGPGSHWNRGPEGPGHMQGHHGWHRRGRAHHFSLSGLALRHRQELALTPAQVDSLRKLGMDARRDAIKRQADRRLAELDLRTIMTPDATD